MYHHEPQNRQHLLNFDEDLQTYKVLLLQENLQRDQELELQLFLLFPKWLYYLGYELQWLILLHQQDWESYRFYFLELLLRLPANPYSLNPKHRPEPILHIP